MVKEQYIQIRVSKEDKDRIKLLSELNKIKMSEFIRVSVDKNIQSLST